MTNTGAGNGMSSQRIVTPDELAQALIRAARAGEGSKVIKEATQMMALYPKHLGLLQGMVEITTSMGDFKSARRLAERMIEIAPDQPMVHIVTSACQMKVYENAGALESLRKAESLSRDQPEVLSMLAKNYEKLDAMADALRVLERLDQMKPNDGVTLQRIAAIHRFLGDLEKAETYCDRSIAANPGDAYVFFLRSDLRKQTVDRNHVPQLEDMLARGPANRRDHAHLQFALAKEYEDLGDVERSFKNLEDASKVQRAGMEYDVKLDVQTMEEIKRTYDAAFFSKLKPGHPAPDPIFVIGMPRTGTTLVERIIASHSKVRSLGELGVFGRLMVRGVKQMIQKPEVPVADRVRLTSQLDFKRIGEQYIAGVADRRGTGGEPHFTDKLPYNYLNIGPIHAALPNAKIIQLDRHPMDTGYAIYKTLFGQAYPFSYTQEELGAYYAGYRKLMDHWHAVLPKGRILKVRYEDLVANQEKETRRIFDYCGLKWEDQARDFHKNQQSTTTASASQVRQPIYSSSIDKWRKYERHLAPFKETLRANGVTNLD
jgi:tetratricopeptide (TPR) repeat protein